MGLGGEDSTAMTSVSHAEKSEKTIADKTYSYKDIRARIVYCN